MPNNKVNSIVLLIGNSIMNKNTAAEFLNSDLPVKHVVICKKNDGGTKAFLKRSVKKHGYWCVFGQIAERLVYKVKNESRDLQLLRSLIDENQINETLKKNAHLIHYTESYESEETLNIIKSDHPDMIVIHTPYWVGKKVRSIPVLGVMGGHPGLTPDYRGIHSPFWAIYNSEAHRVGYTIFWVDAGVDTGDIIFQENISPGPLDSYITLSWKGMIATAKNQIRIAKELMEGKDVPRKKIEGIDESSNYPHPTIWQYMVYRKRQRLVR